MNSNASGMQAAVNTYGAPLFVFRAHCFQIDAKTKRSWLPLSEQAIQISVFFESSRQAFRFVSLEHALAQNGSSANGQSSLDGYVLSSSVLPSTTFTRTSAKFLQWLDVRAQTVFGLGFANEGDLNRFIERFKSIREAFQISTTSAAGSQVQSAPPQSLTPTSAHSSPPAASSSNSNSQLQPVTVSTQPLNFTVPSASQSPALASYAQDSLASLTDVYPNGNNGTTASDTDGAASIGEYVEQLRSENDKLRSALQTNSTNYRKWQEELSNTRSANSKLQTDLTEARSSNSLLTEQLAEARAELARLRSNASLDHDRETQRSTFFFSSFLSLHSLYLYYALCILYMFPCIAPENMSSVFCDLGQ